LTIHDAKPLSDESTARRRHIREGANPLVGNPCCVPQVIGFWRTPVEMKILNKVVCTDAGAMVEAEEVVSSMDPDGPYTYGVQTGLKREDLHPHRLRARALTCGLNSLVGVKWSCL